ncbi:hypothetical protein PAXRUDRAFT_831205 [Paxillus rubicundulus Ve08.2h10]|uniref:Uncharacterized protein n=1 Tax=Paxillus rubicundulus Ve08.2h10 TaxID=930991 RepID=A0A0D0DXG1_9AGAM|nr:hypothetical protein PAXRUDRAFT_831205 [Paxillus rubicundulus Ve08.2h10]
MFVRKSCDRLPLKIGSLLSRSHAVDATRPTSVIVGHCSQTSGKALQRRKTGNERSHSTPRILPRTQLCNSLRDIPVVSPCVSATEEKDDMLHEAVLVYRTCVSLAPRIVFRNLGQGEFRLINSEFRTAIERCIWGELDLMFS